VVELKNKSHPVSQVACIQKFVKFVRSGFQGGYRNDSSLDTKTNGQWLKAKGCSAAPTYICTQTGTPGTCFSIFIFNSFRLRHPKCLITRPCPPNHMPSRIPKGEPWRAVWVRDLPRCSQGLYNSAPVTPAEQIPQPHRKQIGSWRSNPGGLGMACLCLGGC